MPVIKRRVRPTRLSDGPVPTGSQVDDEREFVSNTSLCGLLRQLAHVTELADSIFGEVTESIRDLDARAKSVSGRIERVHDGVLKFNHREVPIPEGDLVSFSQRKDHFRSSYRLTDDQRSAPMGLFNADTRPPCIRELYEEAGQTPASVLVPRDVGDDGDRLLCTPVLGHKRRMSCMTEAGEEALLAIETLKPAHFNELPDWVPEEDDVFLATTSGLNRRVRTSISMSPPPCATPVGADDSPSPVGDDVDGVAAAENGEPESATTPVDVVHQDFQRAVDERVSNRKLPRPEDKVKFLVESCPPRDVVVDVTGRGFDRMAEFRRSLIHFEYYKKKKKKKKRRNSIAGETEGTGTISKKDSLRSKSHKIRDVKEATIKPRRQIKSSGDDIDEEERVSLLDRSHEVTSECSDPVAAGARAGPEDHIDVGVAGRRTRAMVHALDPEFSTAGVPLLLIEESSHCKIVKPATTDDAARSSSGHWTGSGGSADSCSSAHTSVESESPRKIWGLMSPTRAHPEDIPFVDDEESSSVYSCDTEGYYTSFHVDTGISKPLRSQQVLQQQVTPRTLAEKEYEVFGKGSTTSTTNTSDSALTVIAAANGMVNSGTVKRKKVPPPPPKRTCSLERNPSNRSVATRSNRDSLVTVIDVSAADDSDAGEKKEELPGPALEESSIDQSMHHESLELSDFDAPERVDEFKSKTTITAHRIPSMCAITPTPPQSDDEHHHRARETPTPTPPTPSPPLPVAVGGEASVLGDGSIPDLVPQQKFLKVPEIKQPLVPDQRRFSIASDSKLPFGNLEPMLRTSSPTPAALRAQNEARSRTLPLAAPVIKARASPSNSLERRSLRKGARVTLDASGDVIYSSGSLTKRKSVAEADKTMDTTDDSVEMPQPLFLTSGVVTSSAASAVPVESKVMSSFMSGHQQRPDLIAPEQTGDAVGCGVRRTASYKMAAQRSTLSTGVNSSGDSTTSVPSPPAPMPLSKPAGLFRIEPVKTTNIKPIPLIKGDVKESKAHLMPHIVIANPSRPFYHHQLPQELPAAKPASPAPIPSALRSPVDSVAAALEADGYVVRSLVKSPTPVEYKQLAEAHTARTKAASPPPVPAPKVNGQQGVFNFRPGDDLAKAQYSSLPQAVGYPTSLCPTPTTSSRQLLSSGFQQRLNYVIKNKYNQKPIPSSLGQPPQSFRPTQPPRLFTDADYGFKSAPPLSSPSSSGSSTMSPSSPKSLTNDSSTFISSPLQASTPTRQPPPGSQKEKLTLEQLYKAMDINGQPTQSPQQQLSSSTSPSSTRSSSPCSLGSTGSFDFEFKGRRNSWAHPEGSVHHQQLAGPGYRPPGLQQIAARVPEQQTYPRRMSWAAGSRANIGPSPGTSLQDFKKLLARHGPNMNPKPSAVELLKYKPQSSSVSSQPIVGDPRNKQRLLSIASRMGLRSASKFRPPRTDVLSCTIPEDEFETSPSSPTKIQQQQNPLFKATSNHISDAINNNSDSKLDSVANNNAESKTSLDNSLEEDLNGVPAVSSSSSCSSRSSSVSGDANGNTSTAGKTLSDEEKAALETHL